MSTTPESRHETLPLVTRGGDLAIIADARLDNRADLIAALAIDPGERESVTDSELILLSYERWGERCVEHLLGDFAFAVWDGRSQTLFCARDHFGVRPLYYHCSQTAFVFGSEIKALLELPGVPRRLNETRIADYLSLVFEDKTSTFYQDIQRLPPAHTLTVSKDGIRIASYWQLDPARTLRLRSDREYGDAFREVFTEAVRCRLRSAYPIGSLLSGGLDSSSVSCVARDLLRSDDGGVVHTFSAIFEGMPETDEREYMEAVLAGGGFEPHFVYGKEWSAFDGIERVIRQLDEPSYVPNLFLLRGLYTAISGAGFRVLLEGAPGDVTVSHGTGYLGELAARGRWLKLAEETRGLSRKLGVPVSSLLGNYALPPLLHDVRRAKDVLKQLVPRQIRGPVRRALHRNGKAPEGRSFIAPDFARRVRLQERLQSLQATYEGPPRTEREHHWRFLVSGKFTELMEISTRTAAAFGIESRYPFMDRRLMEFCLSLPGDQKLRHGWSRLIMRNAMAGTLPEAVRWRPGKAYFQPMVDRGLFDVARAGVLDDIIKSHSPSLGQYVDVAFLRDVCERSGAGGDNLSLWLSGETHRLWLGLTLALWLRESGFGSGQDETHIPHTGGEMVIPGASKGGR